MPHFSEGQKLGGCYGLKRRVGDGDGPCIWLAHDEVLGKDVSLHFIPAPLLGDATAMNALRQEVKRTRQLIHPNILRVYDLVEDAGWAAISMDAFEGEALAARLEKSNEKDIDPEEIQAWMPQLCQTLEDAHRINVIHRDISPDNIFLTGEGKVIVTNFGIGRCIAEALARVSGNDNARLGAMSPQQLDGVPATRSDDVYGLGALLFELLSGRLPFVGPDRPGQIRNATPPTVSTVRGEGAAPVSESWEKVIAVCLEKKPESRPQSAAEIATRLVAGGNDAAPAALVEKAAVTAEPTAIAVAVKSSADTAKTAAKNEPPPAKSLDRKFAPEGYSNLSPARSRVPAMGFALAAGLMLIGAVGYYINGQSKPTPATEPTIGLNSSEPPDGSELRSVNNNIEPPAQAVKAADLPATSDAAKADPVEIPVAAPVQAKPAVLVAAAATPSAERPVLAPAASSAAMSEEEKIVAEKAAALERLKQAAQGAEKAREEMLKQKMQAEAAVAETEKLIDQKAKTLGPVKKAADDVLAQRKKLEAEQKAADQAAEQARQLAAEKARMAETAKKAIADLEATSKDKLVANEKADAEIDMLQKALAGKQQSAVTAAKAAAEAEAARQQHLAAIKQGEQEVDQAKLVAAEARRLREEAEAERRKLGQELAEMQKMMEKKKREIEDRLKRLENADSSPAAIAPAPEPEARPVERPSTPMPAIKPNVVATPAPATPMPAPATPVPVAAIPKVSTPLPATPMPVAVVPKPATPVPATPAPAPAAPPPADPTQLVMKTEPDKLVIIPTNPNTKSGTAAGAENSLGMRFVSVGGVEFSIWQTRVRDFDVFAKAVNLKSSAWRGPGFKQGPDHPVVNVTWVEAVAFCKWLTDIEHKEGILSAGQYYRLPTDLEWSHAVGLPEEEGKTPEARDMGVADVYPWGTQWPPPPNSGNYTGEETGSDVAIKGYEDGFAWTSPVGSFPPNRFGLYDMGGNVWQWCMDAWNNDSKAKVLRGASWYNGALKLSLLSSCRVHASPDSSTDNYGFRVVRAAENGKSGKK